MAHRRYLQWRSSDDYALLSRPSALGLVLGAAAFALALTPSLMPRAASLQGVLAGLSFAVGYLLGYSLVTLWRWLFERPAMNDAVELRNVAVGAIIGAGLITWALINVTGWQNDINAAAYLPPVESARPMTILLIGGVLATALIFLGRLFRRLWRSLAAQLEPFLPRRVAWALGILVAVLITWTAGNDLIATRLFTMLDNTYAAIDARLPAEQAAPSDPLKSGSTASLAEWQGLGAAGRDWVLRDPDASAISAFTGQPAMDPLRVYIGLNNGETHAERAELALQEALRVGAFERETLVLATPTGTGWMDPAATQPLEYLTQGNVATIAVQYSYLPSWMALIAQPQYGMESAKAVFLRIYGHWETLDPATRPKLYLFGLSLGMRNGEQAIYWPELLDDPIQGALWVGPPFASQGWQEVLASRRPDTPPSAPIIRDGSVIRVMTNYGVALSEDLLPWGAARFLYLVYPTDPIAYFNASILWQAPDWMKEDQRSPGLPDSLRWWPLITFLQLGFDMLTATTARPGYGHLYHSTDYALAWDLLLESGWSVEALARLAAHIPPDGI